MHRGTICCAPESSLLTVARTMAAHRIHCVVVPDHGVVTDVELAAALGNPDGVTAAGLARPAPLLEPGDSLERAAAALRDEVATHALVVAPGSRYAVGVVSTLDLANALAFR
jgi:CBS domain-containing protein